MDEEELLRQLLRTAMLVRRSQHEEEGGPHGEHRPHGNHGPHGEHGHHPGPPQHPRHGQGRVLAMLSLKEGQSQKDLAYLLGIRPQSLSEILLKLEDEGMVERRKSAEDGRVMNVYLTEKGRERAARAAEDRRRKAESVFSPLSTEEKEQLGTILRKLASSLEEE